MDDLSWADRVRNDDALQTVKEEKNILHAVKRREAASLSHILHRNCLLKHIAAVEIKGEGRRVKDISSY